MKLIWFFLSIILFFMAVIALGGNLILAIILFIASISAFKKSGISLCSLIGALILIDILDD